MHHQAIRYKDECEIERRKAELGHQEFLVRITMFLILYLET